MKEKNIIKEQLTNKLVKLNQRIAELEKSVVECQQVEESLRESEEKFRILVEMATDAIFLETVEGRILECNTAGARMFGYTKKYMIGLTIADLVPEEFAKILPKVITEKETTHGIFVPRINKKKDGTLFPTEIATKIVNISEKPRLIVYIRDITKRKKAEIALIESEEIFRITLKNSPIVVWNQDKDLRYTWIYNPNPGFKPEETIGKTDKELLPADDAEKLMHIKRKVLESGIGAREETKTTIQGNDYYYDLTVEPLRDSSNAIIGITCVAIDITSRRKTEQELMISEEKYHTVFENALAATLVIEEDMTIVMANTQVEKLTGYSKEEIENKMKWTAFVVPEDLERMKKPHIERRKAGGKPPTEYEFRLIDKKGTIKNIFIKIGMIPNTKKSIASLIDITELKKSEEKLRDSEERLKILFDYAPDAYYINDLKGKFIDGNKAAERLTGYKREELIGKSFLKLKLLSLTDIPKAAKLLVKNLRGRPTGPDELVLNRKDNSKVAVEISAYPVKIKGETFVLGIARDITQRKQAIKEIEELAKFPTENPNPVLRISMGGTVLYHNHPSESLLEHWHYQEGKPLQDRWCQFVLDALEDNGIKTIETEIDDRVLFLTFVPIVKKDFVNVYGLDITERKQAEERIKHLNLVLRAIRNINQLIFQENDRERLIKGVCNSLTETSGYYHSWIVLLDKEGKIDTHAEAGLEKGFLPILKLLMKNKLTTFGRLALKQRDVVIIKDPASTCPDCPLVQACSAKGSVMTVRLGREGKIYGVMSVSIPTHFLADKEEQALFMEIAKDISLGLHSIEMRKNMDEQTHELQQNYQRTKRAMYATIETMSKIVEAKDPYTAGHQQKVSQLAASIAKELNLSKDKIEGIRIASLIHDIGKISLPTEILSKPTTLSDIEFSLIKEHSQIGYDIIKSIDFSYPIANIILQHHERLDGSGYPNHLKGDEILLEAKIIGVADVVEAMSSFRPYRPALGIDAALEEISKNKGILYDPEVVDVCLKLFKEKEFKFK